MSKASDAANGLMLAVAQVCGLYSVPAFRMQSRTLMVTGPHGRVRPMFMGEWTDDLGEKHRSGMADWLLTPRIRENINATLKFSSQGVGVAPPPLLVASVIGVVVPVWCECKAGLSARMTPDQIAFKTYVENNGAYHIELRDPDELIAFFVSHGVTHA
jgi:hypothetical protein